jgi:hypothetical protein
MFYNVFSLSIHFFPFEGGGGGGPPGLNNV